MTESMQNAADEHAEAREDLKRRVAEYVWEKIPTVAMVLGLVEVTAGLWMIDFGLVMVAFGVYFLAFGWFMRKKQQSEAARSVLEEAIDGGGDS